MLSLSVLDSVVALDWQTTWFKFMSQHGYLQTLCASLQWDDDSIKKMLHPMPEALRALYIYESKMVGIANDNYRTHNMNNGHDSGPGYRREGAYGVYTVEPPLKDTIEITSEQRTSFNGDFPIVLIYSYPPIKDNLSTKDKMARKQWVPNVSVIQRFHHSPPPPHFFW